MVLPPKKPQGRQAKPLHADTSAADGLQLFHDIAANEKALIAAIEDVRESSVLVIVLIRLSDFDFSGGRSAGARQYREGIISCVSPPIVRDSPAV